MKMFDRDLYRYCRHVLKLPAFFAFVAAVHIVPLLLLSGAVGIATNVGIHYASLLWN